MNDSLIVASQVFGDHIVGQLHYSWDGGLTWKSEYDTYRTVGAVEGIAPTTSGFVLMGAKAFADISLPEQGTVLGPRRFGFSHFASYGEMWFANFSGFIHRSTDEGNTWVSTQVQAFDRAEIYPTSDSTFYLVRPQAIDYIELPSVLVTSVETPPENQSDLLNLYPNPASREVSVESDRNISCESIKFLDLLGREVAPVLTTPGTRKRCAFNTEQMPTGNYFVQAQAGHRVLRGSLVVIR